jgi:23S rRNA pseudouridine1911/1915/1917 synthase
MGGVSRSRVQALIRQGHVAVAGRRAVAHLRTAPGLEADVRMPAPEPSDLTPEDIPLDVLFEDSDVLALNKPPGLVVHPAAGHRTGTLVNGLLHHCRDLAGVGGERRPGLVHRLDKDTSGVLVVAKNQAAMDSLAAQFRAAEVRKEYVALVRGVPASGGRIETLIGRSPRDRKKMSARPARGRRAVTHYEVAETFGDASRLRVRIETGRTHQIRVHLAHIGHPVLGDRQYGGSGARLSQTAGRPAAPRQMLHAEALAFRHPRTGREMRVTAPLPRDMAEFLGHLRG